MRLQSSTGMAMLSLASPFWLYRPYSTSWWLGAPTSKLEMMPTLSSPKGRLGSKSWRVDQAKYTFTRGLTIRAPRAKALMLAATPAMG